jgi:hypothetical protein
MNRGWNIRVESLRDAYVGHLRQPLLVFQGAVLILLLIACANVAGLLLAQANARQRELTVRSALGSTRNRVMRQLLAESVSLSAVGGIVGAALGWAGLRILTTALPSVLPAGVQVEMDLRVLAFALGLSLATGVVFGILPAIQISSGDLIGALRESSRSTTASPTRHRLSSAFVVVQVALALVLLIGAGLLTNSLVRLNMVRPGFEPHGVLTVQVPFSRTLYRNGGGNTPTGGLLVEMTRNSTCSRSRFWTVSNTSGYRVRDLWHDRASWRHSAADRLQKGRSSSGRRTAGCAVGGVVSNRIVVFSDVENPCRSRT